MVGLMCIALEDAHESPESFGRDELAVSCWETGDKRIEGAVRSAVQINLGWQRCEHGVLVGGTVTTMGIFNGAGFKLFGILAAAAF